MKSLAEGPLAINIVQVGLHKRLSCVCTQKCLLYKPLSGDILFVNSKQESSSQLAQYYCQKTAHIRLGSTTTCYKQLPLSILKDYGQQSLSMIRDFCLQKYLEISLR